MPKQQLTKEDEKTRDNIRNTSIVGLAALLGIPVAEAGRKQFVGNKILKMMEEGRLGKKLLTSEGGKFIQGATAKNSEWKPNAENKGQPVSLPRTEDGKVPKPQPPLQGPGSGTNSRGESLKGGGLSTGVSGGTTTLSNTPSEPAGEPSDIKPDDSPKTVARKVKVAKASTVRKSANEKGVAKSISELIEQEIARLTDLSDRITRPVQTAIDPKSVDKSVRRQQIKTETAAGLEAGKPVTAASVKTKEAAQKRARAARQAARAPQANATQAWNDLVAAKSNIVPMNVFSQEVQDALTQRLPALSAERRRFTTELHKLQTSIGPKPKGGRTKAARQALSDWNAKNAQIEALTKQIQNYDAVLTPTWSPRPATSQLVNNPGFIMDTYPSMRGADTTGVSLPGLDEYNKAKSEYDKSLFWSGRAGQDVNAAQLADSALSVTPRYSQPMGLTENAVPVSIFGPSMSDNNIEYHRMPVKVPGQEFNPGRDPYSSLTQEPGVGPFSNPGPSSVKMQDVIDPTGMQSMLDDYNAQVNSLRPDFSKEQTAQHTARIMEAAAKKQASPKADDGLIKSIVKMLTPGRISESLAVNLGRKATTNAKNSIAVKRFTETTGQRPNLSMPDDVAKLTDLGWSDPSSIKSGSAISNAANQAAGQTADIADIRVPRTRLGMNAVAADAGRVLGLKDTYTFNPDLKVGDVNLGKLNKWVTGGSIVGTGAMLGYNYLRGKGAEKDAAEIAKKAPKPAATGTEPDALQSWALKKWNSIAGKQGNEYQKGQDIYNAVVNKAKSEGWWQDPNYEEKKKKIQSFWMTFSKQRDGGK